MQREPAPRNKMPLRKKLLIGGAALGIGLGFLGAYSHWRGATGAPTEEMRLEQSNYLDKSHFAPQALLSQAKATIKEFSESSDPAWQKAAKKLSALLANTKNPLRKQGVSFFIAHSRPESVVANVDYIGKYIDRQYDLRNMNFPWLPKNIPEGQRQSFETNWLWYVVAQEH